MAVISASNIKWYLSGGAGNTDPAASLGGARSTTAVTASTIWDAVSGDESSTGDTEYRCIYVRNEDSNASGLQSAKLWIETNTTSANDTITIGLDLAGKNGTADTVGDESTAPDPAVTFVTAVDKTNGLSLGTLSQNDYYPFWMKRVVDSSASAINSNTFTLKVEGDSSA